MNREFWKATIWAGIISGVVMLMLEMIMNPLFLDNSMWGPPRMMGAILLGKEVLPPPADFDFGVLMAAMVVHFPLSIIFSAVIGLIVQRFALGIAIAIGAVIGLIIYFVNFYGLTALFPWFENARNWVQIVIHMMFGLAAAWAFKAIYKEQPKMVNA